jgi:nucleoside-diphosphate-sugar epimerase
MVVITGADGFIGRYLAAALESRGVKPASHSLADGDLAHCRIDWPGATHVFHLAARSFVPDSWADPRGFYETNVLGTINVLEFCRRSGAGITFISSYVYGIPKFLPIPETHPLEAMNPYAQTKIAGEDVCRFYQRAHGVRVSIVRPFNIYGLGQDARFLIPLLIRQALDPATDYIEVADLRPRRDYLHVADLVKLLVRTLDGTGGIYNAGWGASASVAEVIAMINHALPQPKRIVSREQERRDEIPDVVADTALARRNLGWAPEIPLERGLRELLAHSREAAAKVE